MVNSVKYFNEVCIKKFLEFEDKFIEKPTDIASYVINVKETLEELGVKIIQEALEELDQLIKNSSARKEKWSVERNTQKTLVTSVGTVNFKKTYYTNKESGEITCLLDRIMGIGDHKRITEDAVANILKEAVQTSYRRGGENVSIGKTEVSKQTVKNVLHKLTFPEADVPKAKKVVDYLYIDADEDHVALQFNDVRGDLETYEGRYKNNGFIAKLAYVYEGIEKEAPQSKRHRLVNPHYFCGTSAYETNEEFWDDVYGYIESYYDVSKIKKIFLNADGGTWIKGCKSRIAGITYVLDEFHMKKYLVKMTSHMERYFSKEDVKGFRKTINEIIKDNTKEEFKNAINFLQEYAVDDKEKEKIADAGEYFLANWTAAKNRFADRKHVKGCSAEGHVSHVLSSRMSSRPMGWSKLGATQMGKLRAYYLNGGDMLELARYQESSMPKAAGAEEEIILSAAEIIRNTKNRNGMIGKYFDTMPKCEIPTTVRKRFTIQHHIAGL